MRKPKSIRLVLGDTLEDATRCKTNPSDPVCKAFYAGAPVDPWASGGEGTFDPAQFAQGLKNLFSPSTPTYKKSSPLIPVLVAVGGIAVVVAVLSRPRSHP